jgi:hypothetical protein
MMQLARGASLVVVLLLAASVGTASAECAWVLWKYQDMAYTAHRSPVEAIDSFDTRAACVRAITAAEAKFRTDRWDYISRSNETTLYARSGPLGQNREEASVRCLPDTVDPRGSKIR